MNTNRPIYLDNNATTPVDEKVLEQMLPYFSHNYGNASSKTHLYGWEAKAAVDKAREHTASLLQCEAREIYFTSGATEAINTAIKGVFENYSAKGKHFVAAVSEHKAVLDTLSRIEKKGAEITLLSVNREGLIDLEELRNAIRNNTVLVCIMAANNETGVMQDMEKIAALVHEKNTLLFSDTTQLVGKSRVQISQIADIACLSAHKFYGPKGVGALYVKRKNPRASLVPLLDGGGHENGLRSGTLNVPGIVGLGAACEIALNTYWDYAEHTSKLRTVLEQQLTTMQDVYINGSVRNRLPGVTNICFSNIKADELIMKCKNVAFSTGSACTSNSMHPSHVLMAMGLSETEILASARFCVGKNTTSEEINAAAEEISLAVQLLRK